MRAGPAIRTVWAKRHHQIAGASLRPAVRPIRQGLGACSTFGPPPGSFSKADRHGWQGVGLEPIRRWWPRLSDAAWTCGGNPGVAARGATLRRGHFIQVIAHFYDLDQRFRPRRKRPATKAIGSSSPGTRTAGWPGCKDPTGTSTALRACSITFHWRRSSRSWRDSVSRRSLTVGHRRRSAARTCVL